MKTNIRKAIIFSLFFLAFTGCARFVRAITPHTPCNAENFHEHMNVIKADLQKYDLRFFWKYPDGRHFHMFENVRKWVEAGGDYLFAAANGGIFEPDYTPTGLYIEDGVIKSPLNLDNGEGNFYVKPNGIFLIEKNCPRISQLPLPSLTQEGACRKLVV